MAKVKLIRHLSGVGKPDDIVTVSDDRAKLWVEFEGYADYADNPKKQAEVEAKRQKARLKRIAERAPKTEKATGRGGK